MSMISAPSVTPSSVFQRSLAPLLTILSCWILHVESSFVRPTHQWTLEISVQITFSTGHISDWGKKHWVESLLPFSVLGLCAVQDVDCHCQHCSGGNPLTLLGSLWGLTQSPQCKTCRGATCYGRSWRSGREWGANSASHVLTAGEVKVDS